MSIPNGLKLFLSKYKDTKNAFVFCNNIEGTIQHGKTIVEFLNFEKADIFNKILKSAAPKTLTHTYKKP